MTNTARKTSNQLKDEGSFYAAGKHARQENKPRYYGCHCGMRSTLETSRNDFFRGWDDEDFFICRRTAR